MFAWQIWPDKASLDAAEEAMHSDESLEFDGGLPFDASRMILGCLAPVSVMGRD